MYQDLHVIDFHCHFPTSLPWFAGMAPDWKQEYIDRVGERRAKIVREQALAYNKEWRLAWDFPKQKKTRPMTLPRRIVGRKKQSVTACGR